MNVRDLQESVRRLATLDENDDLVLSVYLSVDGGPAAMRHRLRERIHPILPDLDDRERPSVEEALARIEDWIDHEIDARTRGVALFCRAGDERFLDALQFRVELPDSVTVDGLPSIYHLCELKDSYHCYVVLLATETSIRILEVHLGAVTRQIWRDRPELRRRVGREWTKEHYQNHRRVQAQRLVKEMMAILEDRMDDGGYRHLVLAGNPRVLATVREALPKRLREVVIDQLSVSGRTPVEEVVASTLQTFLEEEQRESASMVEELLARLYRDGLAVVGEEECHRALLHDQADQLVVTQEYDGPLRDDLLRMAERSGCQVEFVEDNERLNRVGGVGCLLRYRLQAMATSPAER